MHGLCEVPGATGISATLVAHATFALQSATEAQQRTIPLQLLQTALPHASTAEAGGPELSGALLGVMASAAIESELSVSHFACCASLLHGYVYEPRVHPTVCAWLL